MLLIQNHSDWLRAKTGCLHGDCVEDWQRRREAGPASCCKAMTSPGETRRSSSCSCTWMQPGARECKLIKANTAEGQTDSKIACCLCLQIVSSLTIILIFCCAMAGLVQQRQSLNYLSRQPQIKAGSRQLFVLSLLKFSLNTENSLPDNK